MMKQWWGVGLSGVVLVLVAALLLRAWASSGGAVPAEDEDGYWVAFLAHEDVLEGASWSVADNYLVRKPHKTEGYRGSLPVLFTLEVVELRASGFLASRAMEERDLTSLSRLIGGWKGAKELCPIGLVVEADLWSFYFMGPASAEPAIELVLGELAQDFFGQEGTVRSREDPDWSFHVERLVPSRDEQLALLVQWQLSELTHQDLEPSSSRPVRFTLRFSSKESAASFTEAALEQGYTYVGEGVGSLTNMTLRTWVQLEREGSGQADELLERLRQLDGLAETYGGTFDDLDAWGDSH